MENKRVVIQVFVSSLGWEIYKRYGFLNDLLTHTKQLNTVLGFSCATDPSILSGRYPSEHGHWCEYYYDKKNSPFKGLSNFYSFVPGFARFIFNTQKARKIISDFYSVGNGYTGAFSLHQMPINHLQYFNYSTKKDYYMVGGLSKTDTIFDQIDFENLKYHISDRQKQESENVFSAITALRRGEVSYVFLNLPELHPVLHYYGTEHDAVKRKIADLENKVKRIFSEAQSSYKDVALGVCSNHGMSDVRYNSNLKTRIEKMPFKYGEDYVAIYDATIARFWFFHPQSRQGIVDHLHKSSNEGSVLSDKELKDMGIFFPDRRFGEVIFLLKPHFLMMPNHFRKTMARGMHGYHPDYCDSKAVLLSNKPINEDIHSIVDIRTFNRRLLKIEHFKVGIN